MAEQSKDYAAALFMLAAENHVESDYAQGLSVLLSAFSAQPLYYDLLSSPGIPMGERLAALEEAFGASVPEQVLSFVQLLCENGLIGMLPDCVKEYKKMYDEFSRVSVATVRSSVALREEELTRMREKLEKMSGHRVKLVCSIDPTLLGGVVVEMDGRCIDGSLRRRLHEVKDVMNG